MAEPIVRAADNQASTSPGSVAIFEAGQAKASPKSAGGADETIAFDKPVDITASPESDGPIEMNEPIKAASKEDQISIKPDLRLFAPSQVLAQLRLLKPAKNGRGCKAYENSARESLESTTTN